VEESGWGDANDAAALPSPSPARIRPRGAPHVTCSPAMRPEHHCGHGSRGQSGESAGEEEEVGGVWSADRMEVWKREALIRRLRHGPPRRRAAPRTPHAACGMRSRGRGCLSGGRGRARSLSRVKAPVRAARHASGRAELRLLLRSSLQTIQAGDRSPPPRHRTRSTLSLPPSPSFSPSHYLSLNTTAPIGLSPLVQPCRKPPSPISSSAFAARLLSRILA
jgi:hypothetical protein